MHAQNSGAVAEQFAEPNGHGRRHRFALLAAAVFMCGSRLLLFPLPSRALFARSFIDLGRAEHLDSLLGLLSHIRGACTAAIVKARSVSGSECSSGLKLQIAHYVRSQAPPGLEAEGGREALRFFESRRDYQYIVR